MEYQYEPQPIQVDSDNFETTGPFERIWQTGIPKAMIVSVVVCLGVFAVVWWLI